MTSSWYVAPCLLTLRDEVNDRWPDRDKSSDGTVGDTSHQARPSDHNPARGSIPPGCVRAMDLDSNGAPGVLTDLVRAVLSGTIGDERTWYVIFDGKIYSRTYGWQPRVYTGSNPHDHHVHVSLRGADGITATYAHDLAYDTSPWLPDTPQPPVGDTLPAVRLHRVLEAARHPRREWAPVNVRRVQRALRARGYTGVQVTGRYDGRTRAGVQRFQRSLGYAGRDADGLLGVRSGTLLGAGRFRLLP